MDTILLHPAYFPSIAQMAAVARCKKVVFEVEDNYQKQSYRNRTYIAHANGLLLLNTPIKHTKKGIRQKTSAVKIENSFPWQSHHWKSLESAYRTSPYFEYYEDDLVHLFQTPVTHLMNHNLKIFELLCELLGIEVEITHSKEYEKRPSITDLRYLIDVKKSKNFSFTPYTQVLEANHGFLPNLSVLDLLFNEGTNALSYLESQDFKF